MTCTFVCDMGGSVAELYNECWSTRVIYSLNTDSIIIIIITIIIITIIITII